MNWEKNRKYRGEGSALLLAETEAAGVAVVDRRRHCRPHGVAVDRSLLVGVD